MKYVDVILPLPLEGTFTYAVPAAMQHKAAAGVRVLVPLGKTKTYTALVLRQHDSKPDFDVRDIYAVLDDEPVLLSTQFSLWQWIADYYMAPLGDVYKAALPAGLKAEDGYRPRTELYVKLAEPLRHERALHVALGTFGRAARQQQVFMEYLAMSHWDTIEGDATAQEVEEITRDELMNTTHCTAAVIKSLTERKFLVAYQREVGRLNRGGEPHPENIRRLNEAQQDAYNRILLQSMTKNVVLLHGVTSSGKTEIYIHLIQKALQEHRQVLYLLPEIALTVQITSRLQRVFGSRLGIYHSKYSDAERVEIWKNQLSSHPYDIILGARSAVFLPFRQLGLVIVDEEHETSFKQEEPAPRYHARSAAIMLARLSGAKTVLGTATPSMESYHNAMTGKYGYVQLSTRYKGISLPRIQVVDIKDLQRRKLMSGPFSPQLLAAVRDALAQQRQVILFQNRRGFAPMLECKVCGWVPKCRNCDVSLTYHKNMNQLTCHYCGFTYQVPAACPNCGNTDLTGRGYGTEKIEDYIRDLIPEARVARMDLDTTRTRQAYERLISDFAEGRTNVLIGTQMISKGLDFDRVSVVGILNADSMLNYPDFRAYEHAFMMMSQVSGRAGRRGKQGLVMLQTKNPDLAVIRQVVGHDYQGFYNELMEERRLFRYPPFYHLVYVYLKHSKDSLVETAGIMMGSQLRQWFGARVLGPDKPAVARVKSMNIRKIVLKLENGLDRAAVRQYLRQARQQLMQDKRFAALQVYYDVDPQ
jgi:primosomal protein N' (replication factor Y)